MPVELRWIKLFDARNLPKTDFIRSVQLEGRRICLVQEQGKFYATQSRCPHAGADLSQGWCKNGKLICPFHRYEYDLQSGKGAPGQGDYLNTYPLDVRKDGIYIGWKLPWYQQSKIFRWLFRSSK